MQEQEYGEDPIEVRDTDHYRAEYVQYFVEKWDELIDWEARAKSEGRFFIEALRSRGKRRILDVATGTGFHSIQLLKASFDVTSADGSAVMLTKAFENAQRHGFVLETVHADWRFSIATSTASTTPSSASKIPSRTSSRNATVAVPWRNSTPRFATMACW